MNAKNPLERYFRANQKRLIHKWIHYFDIYHRHFARFRGIVDEFTRSTRSMHIYDSIIVFERGEIAAPHHEQIGIAAF